MKKSLLFCGMCFAICSFGQVQKTALNITSFAGVEGKAYFGGAPRMAIGITGGPVLATFYGSDFKPSSHYVAFRGACGVSFQYNFDRYAIYTDVSFEQKGISAKGLGNMFLSSVQVNYLTIPILFKAGTGKKIYFYGVAGPYLGILLNARSFIDNPNIPMQTRVTNITSDFSKVDAGVTVGAGVRILLRKWLSLTFEERNNVGLMTVSHFVNAGSSIKNFSSTLEIGLAYHFGSRKRGVVKSKEHRI